MKTLKERRNRLGLSQSKLARLSGISRYKICTSELGDTTLTPEDQEKIQQALQAEAARLLEVVTAMVGTNSRRIEHRRHVTGGQAA